MVRFGPTVEPKPETELDAEQVRKGVQQQASSGT